MVTTIISWQRKNSKGGNYFSFGMIAITLSTIAIGLDYAAIPLDLKIFFAKLENTGYNGALALFALFCLSYAGFDDWLKKSWVKSLFWLIPLSSILMAWTNDFHNLLWTDFTVTGLGQNAVIFHHGPGFLWTSITGYIIDLFHKSTTLQVQSCKSLQSD